MVCRLEHLPDGVELVLRKDSISKEIRRELDGYLPDIRTLAVTVLPDMLQILRRNKRQVVIPYGFHTVTYNTPDPRSVLHKVQFKLSVTMKRICKFRLVTFHNMEAVQLRQLCNFRKNFTHS